MKTSLVARIGSSAVGIALLASAIPAFADTSTTTATTTPGTYNVACVQTAVAVHEDAKISAQNTLNAAKNAALITFKAEVVAAWGQTDFTTRFNALKAAFIKMRTAEEAARTNNKSALAAAHTTLKSSMKACGVVKGDLTGTSTAHLKDKKDKKDKKDHDDEDASDRGFGHGFNLSSGFGLHFGNKNK